MNPQFLIQTGDARQVLQTWPSNTFHCCVTSPPYFGLRDYGVANQIGLEKTPDAYVAEIVAVMREVRRVLRDDGTLWLNLGDSYARAPAKGQHKPGDAGKQRYIIERGNGRAANTGTTSLPDKNLLGIPWRVAFALQQDGWRLRQDIIWAKPNPMPESVRDRCTKAHEYIFLLSKSADYYFDADAIAEPVASSTVARLSQPNLANQKGSNRVPGKTNGPMKAVGRASGNKNHKYTEAYDASATEEHRTKAGLLKISGTAYETRNKRSVWTVGSKPFKEAHFATFPPALIEPCILAGSPIGGTVIDPFAGAGTTGLVATAHGRHAFMVELNPAYAEIATRRIHAAMQNPPVRK